MGCKIIMTDLFNPDPNKFNSNYNNSNNQNNPNNPDNSIGSNFRRDAKNSKKIEYVVLVAFLVMMVLMYVRRTKNEEDAQAAANAQYQSIVCLSPAGAEILSDLGAEGLIKARTDFCDYPSRLKAIPSVGGFAGETLSVETILSYKPDFVYGAKGMHDFLEAPLKESGVTLFLSEASSIDAVYDEIITVGGYIGRTSEAETLVKNMKDSISQITTAYNSSEKPAVYYEVWNTPYMSIGRKSFISDLILTAGGLNVFDDQNSDYPSVSEESIIARDPKIILLPNMNGVTADDVKARTGWTNVSAVKSGKIYLIDADLYSRPGPRIVDAVAGLAKILHEEN